MLAFLALFTGGGLGPEASVVRHAALVAALVVVWAKRRTGDPE
jgi:hypothetical protein